MIKRFEKTTVRNNILALAFITIVMGVAIVGGQRAWASASTEDSPMDAADPEPIELAGTEWVLVSVGGADMPSADVPADIEITARFDEERVAGVAGCNNYFAGYEVDGDGLTISKMGMTMMMCPEHVMEWEMAFTSALGSAESYRIDGDTLEITYVGGSLIFSAN
jgi:heat shock protein HslJ